MKFTKYILPVVVGAAVGMLLIKLGEAWLSNRYHLPQGTNVKDTEALKVAIMNMPVEAFILLLINYAIASFAAGVAATLVSGRTISTPAIIVGVVLTIAGLANVIMLPQPLWFSLLNIIAYLPFAYIGYLICRKKTVNSTH